MSTTLNDKQSDLLRYLYRQTGPVPVEHLDGRIVRALKLRDLVVEEDGWLRVNEAGRTEYERNIRRRRVVSAHSAEHGHRQARAEAIHRALDALELAFPRDAELKVGDVPLYADDLLGAMRLYARRLENKA